MASWAYVENTFKVNHEVIFDVLDYLAFHPSEVLTCGTLNKLYEWHITFANLDSADRLVSIRDYTAYRGERAPRVVHFRALKAGQTDVSILWVPSFGLRASTRTLSMLYHVPHVLHFYGSFGEVQSKYHKSHTNIHINFTKITRCNTKCTYILQNIPTCI